MSNQTRHHRIAVFANTFGFGPVSKAVSVISAMKNKFDGDYLFCGSSTSKEISHVLGVEYMDVDERNVDDIKAMLKEQNVTHVVSSLNRFAIHAASELGITSAVIDGLAWMWADTSVPDGLLLADHYFVLNFPGVEQFVVNHPTVRLVPYIAAKPRAQLTIKSIDKLIHIGGVINPFSKDVPADYMQILASIISQIPTTEKVLVCGSSEALSVLKAFVTRQHTLFVTFPKSEFDTAMQSSKSFISTPGLTGCVEAFIAGVPTHFLPPMNLSQMKNLENFRRMGLVYNAPQWQSIVPAFNPTLIERIAVQEFEDIAKFVNSNAALRAEMIGVVIDGIQEDANVENQARLAKVVGWNGAEVIAAQLGELWSIQPTSLDRPIVR